MFTLVFFMELLALLAALCWCNQRANPFRLFIPFLLFTIAIEVSAYYVGFVKHIPNYFIYTIYIVVALPFLAWMVRTGVVDPNYRRIIVIGSAAGVLLCILNAFFLEGFRAFNRYSFTLMSVWLIISSMVYLLDFMQKEEADISPLSDPVFWVVAGILFFQFGSILLNLLYNYSVQQEFKINGKKMYSFINQFLNLLMYSCFIIAFRVCYRKKKFSY